MFAQLKRATWKAILLTMLFSLVGVTIALAASGDLDTTFSGDGKQTTDIAGHWDDDLWAIARQSDGKIVAVGERYDPANWKAPTHDFALARYQSNGSLDTSFSGDGKQLTNFGGLDIAFGVAIQPSTGKIVVSGQKCTSALICDVALARYNANGTLDTTFSGDGKQTIAHGTEDNGAYGGLAIQSDGKIVMAGYMVNSHGDYDFAVYRVNANGSLDNTFSGDGRVNLGFGAGRQDDAPGLILRAGKIIIAGKTCDATWKACNFAIARLNSDGTLDTTFSADGKQTTDFGGSDAGYALAVQSDGKILVAGEKHAGTVESIALARYKNDGSLDTTFSTDGKQTVTLGSEAYAHDVLVQPDGKIVVAAQAHNGAEYDDFAIVRLNPGGSLDTTFSGDGKLLLDITAGHDDRARGLIRQPDGKYVLGGGTYDGTQVDFALARVLP